MSNFMHSTEVTETYTGSGIFEVRCVISEDLMAYYVDHKDALATALASDIATSLVACFDSTRLGMKRRYGLEGI